MTRATTAPLVSDFSIGTIDEAIDEYSMSLRAQNKSPATITVYLTALQRLNGHLKAKGMPTELSAIRRDNIEDFLVGLQEEGRTASTVSVYYRSLQPFWKWAVEQGEIDENPMRRMKPPKVQDKPVPVLEAGELDAILATVQNSKRFEDVRDLAIFRLLLDTGMRRGSLAGLRYAPPRPIGGFTVVGDIHFAPARTSEAPDHYVTITGKGRRTWDVGFSDETAIALKRYLRAREKHAKAAGSDALWIGYKGALTGNGILQVMRRRAAQAGLDGKLFVHRWRHHRAHDWLAQGGSETGLMRVMGWSSPAMLRRYGASAAEVRAREEFRRIEAKRKG